MKSSSQTCSLCYKSTRMFHLIENTMREIFDVLCLKFSVKPTEEQVICNKCSKTVENLLDFKSKCLYTEDYLYPLANEGEVDFRKICLEMSDIHAENKDNTMRGYEACQCCMQLVESNLFLPITQVKKDTLLMETLTEYFSELKILKVATGSGICDKCIESLKAHYKFVTHLNTDGKRVETNVNNSKPTSEDTTSKAKDSFQPQPVNRKEVARRKKTRNFLCLYCPLKYKTLEHLQHHKRNAHSDKMQYECDICFYATNSKHLFKTHDSKHKEGKHYKCEKCPYKVTHRSCFKRHLIVHRNPGEEKDFKCDKCEFSTNRKEMQKLHLDTHKKMSERKLQQCPICSVKIASKMYRHMRLHKLESGEGRLHKCSICMYTTARLDSLTRHSLIHKSDSEVKTFNCEKCPYKTKIRYSLKTHMLKHKTKDEVAMYTCSVCSYSSKYRGSVRDHERVHKSLQEVQTFKCYHCRYETKIKKSLETHMLTHRSRDEVTMHKCKLCSFETMRVQSMKKHVINAHYDELYV